MTDEAATAKNTQVQVIQRLVDGLARKSKQLEDQRSIPRYPLNVRVTLSHQIKRSEQTHIYASWATEISHEGISLLTSVELFPEKPIFINFDPAIGHPCYLKILVTHCDKLVEGIYRSGGTFVLDDEEEASRGREPPVGSE